MPLLQRLKSKRIRGGADGLSALTYAEEINNTGILLRDAMTEYVQEFTANGKAIESKLDNRVIKL